MAADQALLEGRAPGFPWSLRLYGWIRPTVSLGFAQPWREGYDPATARRRGVGLVRRPTGGRAVLHGDEITYAFSGPITDGPLAQGILPTYRELAEGLAGGLRTLGCDVAVWRMTGAGGGPAEGEGARSGACFGARARYELVHDGRKLAGSAQRRSDGRVLQHGSIPVGTPDPRLWRSLGAGGPEAARDTVGCSDVLGRRPAWRELAVALATGLAERLGLEMDVGQLTVRERRRAAELVRRYRDADWTLRR